MTRQKQIEFQSDGDGSAPEDAPRKRKQTKRKKAEPGPAAESDAPEDSCRPRSPVAARISTGKISDCGVACPRCDADEYDVVEERFATVLAECVFCGLLNWIEKPRSFRSAVIPAGQMKGLTVRQAVAKNRRIVEHLAARTPWIREELLALDGTPVAE